jgi:hypothetical protein
MERNALPQSPRRRGRGVPHLLWARVARTAAFGMGWRWFYHMDGCLLLSLLLRFCL